MCYLVPDASGNRKVIFYSDAFGINHKQTGEKFVGQGKRFTLSCILQTGPKYGRMGSFFILACTCDLMISLYFPFPLDLLTQRIHSNR